MYAGCITLVGARGVESVLHKTAAFDSSLPAKQMVAGGDAPRKGTLSFGYWENGKFQMNADPAASDLFRSGTPFVYSTAIPCIFNGLGEMWVYGGTGNRYAVWVAHSAAAESALSAGKNLFVGLETLGNPVSISKNRAHDLGAVHNDSVIRNVSDTFSNAAPMAIGTITHVEKADGRLVLTVVKTTDTFRN